MPLVDFKFISFMMVLTKQLAQWVYLLSGAIPKVSPEPNFVTVYLDRIYEPAFVIYVLIFIITKIGSWLSRENEQGDD